MLAARPALAALLKLQGRAAAAPLPRQGLHPLVSPFAHARAGGDDSAVLGMMRWPLGSDTEIVVEAQRQSGADDPSTLGHAVRPMGTLSCFLFRQAVEADANGNRESLVAAASAAAVEAGGASYNKGDLAASKLRVPQFLLLKVSTSFPDVWESLAWSQLERGDETAALVAAERGAANNPGWGSCFWVQARLMQRLGRSEERRDIALAALETPFWSIGAPLAEVQAAAGMEHVEDVRALMRALEDKVREQQQAPPRSEREMARIEALHLLDDIVRTSGSWDAVRPRLAELLDKAGCAEDAEMVKVDI